MELLPDDINIVTALNLKYEDILRLCRVNKKFNKICQNPYFWELKLDRDYPEDKNEKIRSKLLPQEYKIRYEQLYAEILLEDLDWDDDEIVDKVQSFSQNINRKAPYDHKYIEIVKNRDEIIDLKYDADNIDYLEELLEILNIGGLKLRKGNLVGITTKKGDNPEMLFYITNDNNGNIITPGVYSSNDESVTDYPEKLIKNIKKQGYKIEDIPKLYNLPFELS